MLFQNSILSHVNSIVLFQNVLRCVLTSETVARGRQHVVVVLLLMFAITESSTVRELDHAAP